MLIILSGMMAGWLKIYSTDDFYKAEMVRHVLIDHEIDAVLLNKKGFPYNIGPVEVYIHQENFNRAIEIIIKNEL